MKPARFLAYIAAVLRSPSGEYLLMKRSSTKDYASGAWECVTGRVGENESFEQALHREIREETAMTARIEYPLGTAHFYRGEAKPENEMLGVVYSCRVDDPEKLRLSNEHSEYVWLSPASALELLAGDEPGTRWMRKVIEKAEVLGTLVPGDLAAYIQQYGFEID